MAVYQGARPLAAPVAIPRRRQPARRRARRGGSPVGLVLGAILVVFLLALFYLTQTIGAATAAYDIDRLRAAGLQLDQQVQTIGGETARWGAEPAIVSAAQQDGLGHVSDGLRVTGR